MMGQPDGNQPTSELGRLVVLLDDSAPKTARDLVADLAVLQGLSPIEYRLRVAVSEIVTNAYVHANNQPAAAATVVIARVGKQFRVTVYDSSKQVPRMLEPAENETSGRGLILVSDVTDACGHYFTESGKAVWFEIAADWPVRIVRKIRVHACWGSRQKCERGYCGEYAAMWLRLESGGLVQYCLTHWREIAIGFIRSGYDLHYTDAAYNRLRDNRCWEAT